MKRIQNAIGFILISQIDLSHFSWSATAATFSYLIARKLNQPFHFFDCILLHYPTLTLRNLLKLGRPDRSDCLLISELQSGVETKCVIVQTDI